jgi:hypothetical protein
VTLHRLPKHLPAVALLLDDLHKPSTDALAHTLGVSTRTVQRWQVDGAWPRTAHLALYFASRWGWSAVDSEARHAVQLFERLAGALQTEVHQLRALLAQPAQVNLWSETSARPAAPGFAPAPTPPPGPQPG